MKPAIFLLVALAATSATAQIKPVADVTGLPSRIAFGSCCKQTKPQPILNTIVALNPELMIYLGDNIYGDTKDMEVLKAKYQQLGEKPEFQNLRRNIPTLAVWDDHDYGWNDAGKEYPFKVESKEIFLKFWHVPDDSPRRSHPGIYGSHDFEADGKRLQIILLDTRTFRDPLKRNAKIKNKLSGESKFKNAYQPDPDPNKTLLGEAQWKWLASRLKEPADMRVICSSIQFGHEYNGWESWTNLPKEWERMVDLIKSTRANGVVFISGDVHWGEISQRDVDNGYPLFDVTASGLTEDWHNVEPNKFRVGEAWRANHFGMIEVDWNHEAPKVSLKIVDVEGKVQNSKELALSQLQFAEVAP